MFDNLIVKAEAIAASYQKLLIQLLESLKETNKRLEELNNTLKGQKEDGPTSL